MMRKIFSSQCAAELFARDRTFASPALVFFAVALVMFLQIPANLIVRAGLVSTGILLNELIAVAGVPLFFLFALRLDGSKILPVGRIDVTLFAMLSAFMLGAVVLLDYATLISEKLFPLSEEIKNALDAIMDAKSGGMIAWKLFLLCIMPGVCEEIFLRGFCQGSLAAKWGNTRAIVVTAALFAMMHGNLNQMHLYFMLGIVFGWVFSATGSIWAAIFCHAFNNSWTFINHVRGFEFPIGRATYGIDAAIAVIAAIFVATAAVMIVRRRSRF